MAKNLFDLTGETAVVIGATGVLGGALAEGLAAAGAQVAVLGRNEDRGLARVKAIEAAGGEAAFLEDGVDFCGVFEVEDGLDGAGVFSGADEGFFGALAEDHFQGSDDDGFPGSGLAGDGDEAGAELPCEFVDEGEVVDFEEGEHWWGRG